MKVEDKMFVVTHKKPECMIQEDGYEYVSVGGKKSGIKASDDCGDNISYKNPNYCELTALYWIWKNQKLNNVGLCHYRRFFSIKDGNEYRLASIQELNKKLEECDIVVPKGFKFYTDYFTYYEINQKTDALKKCCDFLAKIDPSYKPYIRQLKSCHIYHCYNMMYTSKDVLNRYCEWLFGLLFEFEKRIDISSWSIQQKRVFGYLSECLFNLWVKHEKLIISECDVVMTESFPCGRDSTATEFYNLGMLSSIKLKLLAYAWPLLRGKKVKHCLQ